MAVTGAQVVVTDSATALGTPQADGPSTERLSVLLKNVTGSESIFLGDADVTSSDGFEWATADGPISVDLAPGETLYGVVATNDQDVHVLRTGR